MPLISGVELEELNKLKRPLVMPHLDESGWLVKERGNRLQGVSINLFGEFSYNETVLIS